MAKRCTESSNGPRPIRRSSTAPIWSPNFSSTLPAHEGPHRLRARHTFAHERCRTRSPPSSTPSKGHGFDSLWLSERLTGDCPDPLIGLAVAAGRTTEVEARHERASAAGPQPGARRQGVGQPRPALGWSSAARIRTRRRRSAGTAGVRCRARRAGEMVRRSPSPDPAALDGGLGRSRRRRASTTRACRCGRSPLQQPPDVWLGGIAPSELKRVGRLGDGWLPSFCTPADVERSRPVIEEAAAEHGRAMDDEHWAR